MLGVKNHLLPIHTIEALVGACGIGICPGSDVVGEDILPGSDIESVAGLDCECITALEFICAHINDTRISCAVPRQLDRSISYRVY